MKSENQIFEVLRYRAILQRRKWRLQRLTSINAPESIIKIEKVLISQAENKLEELEKNN